MVVEAPEAKAKADRLVEKRRKKEEGKEKENGAKAMKEEVEIILLNLLGSMLTEEMELEKAEKAAKLVVLKEEMVVEEEEEEEEYIIALENILVLDMLLVVSLMDQIVSSVSLQTTMNQILVPESMVQTEQTRVIEMMAAAVISAATTDVTLQWILRLIMLSSSQHG